MSIFTGAWQLPQDGDGFLSLLPAVHVTPASRRHFGAMHIARVIGEVVASGKDLWHEGRKILLVQPLDLDGRDRGAPLLALDAVDAGVGYR